MTLKEYLRPTMLKVILTMVLALLVAIFPTYEQVCMLCEICINASACPPCPCWNEFVYFGGLKFLGGLFDVFTSDLPALILAIVVILILSYLVASTVLHFLKKY